MKLLAERMVMLIADRIAALKLDLTGLHVLTEAATGAYAVTPVIAAMAGANVVAMAKATQFGDVAQVAREVLSLAEAANVRDQIRIVESIAGAEIRRADIVTNSGHLRPLDAIFVSQMKPDAVIPLMYESWELRPGEVDLDLCRQRGIRVAGTNECHPDVGVFQYLGILALQGLLHCRIPVCFSRILLICDNPFARHIAKTLVDCGVELEVFEGTPLPEDIKAARRRITESRDYDAVVVASTPCLEPIIGRAGESQYSPRQIGTFEAIVQIWGDLDRSCMPHVLCYPPREPRRAHMGILLSELGPEPIVRLQAAGLKVGEVLHRNNASSPRDSLYCQVMS